MKHKVTLQLRTGRAPAEHHYEIVEGLHTDAPELAVKQFRQSERGRGFTGQVTVNGVHPHSEPVPAAVPLEVKAHADATLGVEKTPAKKGAARE